MNKFNESLENLPALSRTRTYKLATITQIDNVGIKTVASIRTSSGTFITNGYLSHNTYQYVTRDTFGFAMKATSAVINGERKAIFKDPKTGDSSKKSAKGLLTVGVNMDTGTYTLKENVTEAEEREGCLQTVYEDGNMLNCTDLADIRQNLRIELENFLEE